MRCFTPSTTRLAGSGWAVRYFHRDSLTCPQIKAVAIHRTAVPPARVTEALRKY
jgi:hypothetical protein